MEKPDLARGLRMAVRALLDTRLTKIQARRLRKLHGVDHEYGVKKKLRQIAREENRNWTSIRDSRDQAEERLGQNAIAWALFLMASSRELEWADEHQCNAGCMRGPRIECSYPYGWYTTTYFIHGRGWVEEKRWGRQFVDTDRKAPLTPYHMEDKMPTEVTKTEWLNPQVDSHEGFVPMSTVAGRMSGRPSWHESRQAIYDRSQQVAELRGHESEESDEINSEHVPANRGEQSLAPRPGRDAWESDRVSPQ